MSWTLRHAYSSATQTQKLVGGEKARQWFQDGLCYLMKFNEDSSGADGSFLSFVVVYV